MSEPKTVIIVGGGLSGLTAATSLQDYHITILDKGYGIGGRLASRALKSDGQIAGFFDYGMQAFKAHDVTFQAWVDDLIQKQVVTQWGGAFQQSNGNTPTNSAIYFRGITSNRAIAQYLATDLNIRNQTRVEHITWEGSQWRLSSTQGKQFWADAVIMTPPVPQTLDIFAKSNLEITQDMRSRLEQIAYAPCLSLMVVFDQPSHIPAPGGITIDQSPLYWMASNHMKGISPQGYAVTLLATPTFSQDHWDHESEDIIQDMLQAAQPWLDPGSKAIASRLHRWKYSYPTTVFGARATLIEAPGPLILAGDAFCDRPSSDIALHLEQAFLSGRHAAQLLSR